MMQVPKICERFVARLPNPTELRVVHGGLHFCFSFEE